MCGATHMSYPVPSLLSVRSDDHTRQTNSHARALGGCCVLASAQTDSASTHEEASKR